MYHRLVFAVDYPRAADSCTRASPGVRQAAARTNSKGAYERFVSSSMTTIRECTLRGQLETVGSTKPVDISEVEPASEIVKRFCTGEMLLWNFGRRGERGEFRPE